MPTKQNKPAKVMGLTVKQIKKSKKAKIKFNKVIGASAYKIVIAENKGFTKRKRTIMTSRKSSVIKKLKHKKVYWIRVCACKITGDKVIYGAYSKKYKLKMK